MTTENLALFKALGAKMNYLNQRQRVISQNIANADTVGYKPHDLQDADFGRIVERVTKSKSSTVRMDTTNPAHMPPPNSVPEPRNREQKITYEVAPAGNAVIMEEQMIKAGKTVMDYNLMSNLYTKNVSMLRTALGAGR